MILISNATRSVLKFTSVSGLDLAMAFIVYHDGRQVIIAIHFFSFLLLLNLRILNTRAKQDTYIFWEEFKGH